MMFKHKAFEIHGDKYDYSKSVYVNNKTPVTILCPLHGEFRQRPDNHLQGKGCRKCGMEVTRKSRVSDKKEFVNQSEIVHGCRYDYSFVDYKNAHTPVKIICGIHGEFLQQPQHHLRGSGCRKCNTGEVWNLDDFVSRALTIHGDKYDYSDVVYFKSRSKVRIRCREHGYFMQSPNSHFRSGCPNCATFGFRDGVQGYIYVLLSDDRKYMKIGISNNPDERISQLKRHTPFGFEIISVYEHPNPRAEEQRLHSLHESANFKGFDGCTEWRIAPVVTP